MQCLAERVSRKLFGYIKNHPDFRRVVRQVTAAYIGRFPGWKPSRKERAEITAAVAKDLGVEIVDTRRRPLRVCALVKERARFNRQAEPRLLHPDDVSDDEALKILRIAIKAARQRGPFLMLDRESITGKAEGTFFIFDLRN
ncbi:MAG: hypothetical protein OEV37_00485 [Candidatus Berkelbacteria bacterium]|nr:hypothetical protein [Candidatus Berkelbacteria bacterium]